MALRQMSETICFVTKTVLIFILFLPFGGVKCFIASPASRNEHFSRRSSARGCKRIAGGQYAAYVWKIWTNTFINYMSLTLQWKEDETLLYPLKYTQHYLKLLVAFFICLFMYLFILITKLLMQLFHLKFPSKWEGMSLNWVAQAGCREVTLTRSI